MPTFTDPLELLNTYLRFRGRSSPDVKTGEARLYFDSATGLLYVSMDGGAYYQLSDQRAGGIGATQLATGAVTPAKLAAPRIRVYQEVVAVTAFTDGLAAAGTLDLGTTIPAGARFLNSLITGLTGFAGDVSAVLTIGDGTDVDRYNTGTPDVFTTAAAGVDLGAPSGTAWHSAVKTPKLTVTTSSDFTLCKTNALGAATITLVWIDPI